MGRLRDLFNLLRWELSRSTKRIYQRSAILVGIVGTLFFFYDVAEHFLHWFPEPPEKLLYFTVAILIVAGLLHLLHQ
jgi:hypothetical protein